MHIKKMQLINFKDFDKKEFTFDEINQIEGKNGSGKTTILDAIFFCFYNRTADGNLSGVTKHIKKGEMKATVAIELSDGRKIIRERTKTNTRISLVDGSQSTMDSVISQRDLESFIPDFDIFQSIVNVGSFMSQPDKKRREMLMKLTKPVDRKEIFLGMGGKEPQINLYNLDLGNVGNAYTRVRKDFKRNQELIAEARAIIGESESIIIPEIKGKDYSKDLAELVEKGKEIAKNETLWQTYKRDLKRKEEIKKSNNSIKEAIKVLEKVIGKKTFDAEIETLERQISTLKDQINKSSALVSNVFTLPEKNSCPTCSQEISKDFRAEMDEASRSYIEEENNRIKKFQEALKKKEAEMSLLRSNKEIIDGAIQDKKLKEASLRPLPNPKKPEVEEMSADDLRKKHMELSEKQREYQESLSRHNQALEMEKERKEKIKEKKEYLTKLAKENEDLQFLISILSPKGLPSEEMKRKLEPIMEVFNKFLPTAKIVTLEPMKNGMEYKEVLKIEVSGKNYNKMSLGESKKVDIVLSQIINKFDGSGVDMFFLDNAESIDHEITMSPQAFIAKVTKGKLTVTKHKAKTNEEIEELPF